MGRIKCLSLGDLSDVDGAWSCSVLYEAKRR